MNTFADYALALTFIVVLYLCLIFTAADSKETFGVGFSAMVAVAVTAVLAGIFYLLGAFQ